MRPDSFKNVKLLTNRELFFPAGAFYDVIAELGLDYIAYGTGGKALYRGLKRRYHLAGTEPA
jgi:hypothetical protein